ncbi:MAG: hypothetical protein CBD88_08310 [Flavobacteriales bacterium TMED228]|nr:MAG: hypothetical protein CBD88_08310 [Flavobacteriales bacterium TMED228]
MRWSNQHENITGKTKVKTPAQKTQSDTGRDIDGVNDGNAGNISLAWYCVCVYNPSWHVGNRKHAKTTVNTSGRYLDTKRKRTYQTHARELQ